MRDIDARNEESLRKYKCMDTDGFKKDKVECVHKWVHLSTHSEKIETYDSTTYIKYDEFFCEKCLEQATKTQKTVDYLKKPFWYKIVYPAGRVGKGDKYEKNCKR